MQNKFEINWDYHPINRNKLFYVKNRVKKKTLQYLKPYLQLNLITFFAIIENLFNYLKDIFGDFYQKKRCYNKVETWK